MNSTNQSFKKFMILWSGEFISAIGSGITSFGLGVYVYQQTGKASAMALVTLFAFMPSLLLSAAAGVLADRYDRRLLMILGDGLSMFGLIFILLCMLKGEASLWQICVGVTISSVFSSLLEPAYKATITDMLTKEQYTKASGLVQVAGSAKYLISPIIAGILLHSSDIKLLLIIDIGTIFVTVATTLAIRKGITKREQAEHKSFVGEWRDGWEAVSCNKGVMVLIIVTSVLTFFIGFIQTLFTPMILAFTSSSVLGVLETLTASGMLVTSVVMGVFSTKGKYVKKLSISLFLTGVFMAGFGLRENIILIGVSGFLLFSMLPFANTSLDYLLRTNIENSVQGRAWGLIGVISQLGYVVSYAISGVLADYVFTPLLLNDGILAGSVGKIIGTGSGRGTGFLILLAGIFLSATSLILYRVKSVKSLESRGGLHVLQNHPL